MTTDVVFPAKVYIKLANRAAKEKSSIDKVVQKILAKWVAPTTDFKNKH